MRFNASAAETLAKTRMGFDADNDAVLGEGDVGGFRVDRAGRMRITFQIIPAVGRAKELCLEGSLEGVAAHFQFDGVA